MSDTPRTDALWDSPAIDVVPYNVALDEMANFARKLERELAAVTKERDNAVELLYDVMKYRYGKEPYDYYRVHPDQQGNAIFDGWNHIEDRINELLNTIKLSKP